MNATRMQMLIDLVVDLHKNKAPIDLGHWLTVPVEVRELPADRPGNQKCGTVGCLIGWAMVSPEFQAEGLLPGAMRFKRPYGGAIPTATDVSFGLEAVNGFIQEGGGISDEENIIIPTFDRLTGWDAIQAFFDISQTKAQWMFCDHSYDEETEIACKPDCDRILEHIRSVDKACNEGRTTLNYPAI